MQYQHSEQGVRENIFVCEPILREDRVNIVLANSTMLKWARQYLPGRVLVMDTTFGMNKLGYPLLVVMVIDDHGCGLPIAFGILKHQSELEFLHALQQLDLKVNECNNVEAVKPASYMTDCDKAEIKALKYASLWIRTVCM
jgi:MULE transposase domain